MSSYFDPDNKKAGSQPAKGHDMRRHDNNWLEPLLIAFVSLAHKTRTRETVRTAFQHTSRWLVCGTLERLTRVR